MTPCRDADTINYFANHPTIRPHIGGEGFIDLKIVTYAPNVALFGEHGGFCLSWTAPDVYEVHTMILPEGRGAWAFDWAAKSIEYMVSIGAQQLWTRVHPTARHTAIFTRKMGFKEIGTLPTSFGGPYEDWRLFDWRVKCQQQ